MSRRNSLILFIPLVAVLVVVDRLSKAWADGNLEVGRAAYDFVVVRLTLVYNYGAAFGLGQGNGLVFVAVAAVILVAMLAWLLKVKEHGVLEVVSLGLVAAGAVGNAIDRVAAGRVTDFFEFTFIDFPVFNVADICVTCGVVLFVIAALFFMPAFAERDEQ